MKIALVHDHLISSGGGERVLEAFTQLWPEAPIFTLIHNEKYAPNFIKGKDIRTSFLQNLPLATSKYQWYLPLRTYGVESMSLDDYDIVLSNSSAHVKGIKTSNRTIHINYCHTPTRYLWVNDGMRMDSLERIWPVSWLSDQYKKYLRKWDLCASKRVDVFIANSENIRLRIQSIYQRDARVIYPPVDIKRFLKHVDGGFLNKREKYFLTGGRLVAYKRFDIVVKAFTKMKIPLKIFGVGPDEMNLRAMAGGNIEFLGKVEDEDLPGLYAKAQAFINPQEEDFGIIPVEAMASGTPVISYRAGGALETVIDGITGEFFDDHDWESLAYVVIRFDTNRFDKEFIQNHARKFSTQNFKDKIKELVEGVSLEVW